MRQSSLDALIGLSVFVFIIAASSRNWFAAFSLTEALVAGAAILVGVVVLRYGLIWCLRATGVLSEQARDQD